MSQRSATSTDSVVAVDAAAAAAAKAADADTLGVSTGHAVSQEETSTAERYVFFGAASCITTYHQQSIAADASLSFSMTVTLSPLETRLISL